VLARVVCRSIGDPSQSRNRGYVDDRTLAGREHPHPERLAQQKWSGEVHVDDSAPLGSGRLLGWGDQGDAGVVDEDVHPAESLQGAITEPEYVILRRDVADDCQDFGASRFQ